MLKGDSFRFQCIQSVFRAQGKIGLIIRVQQAILQQRIQCWSYEGLEDGDSGSINVFECWCFQVGKNSGQWSMLEGQTLDSSKDVFIEFDC